MSRKHQIKSDAETAVAKATSPNDRFVKAALFTVDTAGQIINKQHLSSFLLNPNTIEDNKSGNWVENNIPGQSDPVLQWVSGGARNLNFTALVTRDTANSLGTDWENIRDDTVLTAVGSIASRLVGINVPPLADAKAAFAKTSDSKSDLLGISVVLDYYRSLMYPVLDENGTLESSPPLVVFAMGTTLSSILEKKTSGSITGTNTDLWITKNVGIRVTKWLPNLTPMEAEVTFQFVQYRMNTQEKLQLGDTTNGIEASAKASIGIA